MVNYGRFTDYDSILFENGEEYIIDKYFSFLEENINNGLITNCSYNPIDSIFNYQYKDEYYAIKVFNDSNRHGETRNLRVLLTYVELENGKRVLNNDKRQEQLRREELLADAKNGNVKTDEQRLIYLDYLKNELKTLISSQFKFTEEYDGNDDQIHSLLVGLFVSVLLGAFGMLGPSEFRLFGSFGKYITPVIRFISVGAAVFIMRFAVENTISPFVKVYNFLARIVHFIPNLIIGTIKLISKALPEIKTIIHKIKWLSNYKLPSTNLDNHEENLDDPVNEDSVLKRINELNVFLEKLNVSDKQKFLKELLGKVKEYQDSLRHLKGGELTTTNNEQYIRNAFLSYLNDLEDRIYKSKNVTDYDQKLDGIINKFQTEIDSGSIEVVDGKVRKRAIGG